MEIGFALIPDKQFQNYVSEIANKLYDEGIFCTKFGIIYNLPHITLYQGEFDDDFDYKKVLEELSKKNINLNINFDKVIYINHGWYFYEIIKQDWLQQLHEELLEIIKKDIRYNNMEKRLKDGNMSEQHMNAIKKYNYRYAGDAYLPHLTIGRYMGGFNSNLLIYLGEQFSQIPKEIKLDKVTVYEMGVNGTHKKVLAEIKL